MNFETTMTEADFTRPLLEAKEEHLAAQLRPQPDLTVDGLGNSLLSRLLMLFSRAR